MNKKLFIVKNIIFLINVILFITCILKGLCVLNCFNMSLFYLVFLAIIIITALDIYKNKKIINHNNKYNLMFIISNVAIMVVLLRGLFDFTIISNVFDPVNNRYDDTDRMSFVINNLIYINIIYVCLILYRLTLIKKITIKK